MNRWAIVRISSRARHPRKSAGGRAADARPAGTSCGDELPAFQLQRLRGEEDARLQVLGLQIRKLREHVRKGVAAGEVFEDGFHRVAEAADGGLTVAYRRINGDAREQAGRRCGSVTDGGSVGAGTRVFKGGEREGNAE